VRNALLNSLVLIPALVAAQTPVLQAAPVSVSFVATGQGQPFDWKASSDAAWLTVLPADGPSPGIIQVEESAEALAPGTYVATVTVTMEGAPNSPARIPVQVTVQR
jgi:hypothetical protein